MGFVGFGSFPANSHIPSFPSGIAVVDETAEVAFWNGRSPMIQAVPISSLNSIIVLRYPTKRKIVPLMLTPPEMSTPDGRVVGSRTVKFVKDSNL
jgi:hypothetical protein